MILTFMRLCGRVFMQMTGLVSQIREWMQGNNAVDVIIYFSIDAVRASAYPTGLMKCFLQNLEL